MAVTKEQRRAALIALIMTASAGGGYVAKDELIAIGQRYCGPVPKAVLELYPHDRPEDRAIAERIAASEGIPFNSSGDRLLIDATPRALQIVNEMGPKGVKVKLDLGKAQGLLASWCDPDRQQINDDVTTKLTKGVQ